MTDHTFIPLSDAGVCSAKGFIAAGITAGIKRSGKPDLALIVSEHPATVAGCFTKNAMAAAPVVVDRTKVAHGKARAIVVNSGCANAATGPRGIDDANVMCKTVSGAIGVDEDHVLVCSTGLIGSYLPMDVIALGIEKAAHSLTRENDSPALAIMTTDTRPKTVAIAHPSGWTMGAIAKGAGMISPNMATMLAFITTDAEVEAAVLQGALSNAIERTFNRITIDADTSTNDTVLALANGASGITPSLTEISEALDIVCRSLAEQIVADGEGATKFVRVRVRGARDESQALTAARKIADSLLVKTAVFGGDANWGRIAAAIGNAEVEFDASKLGISVSGFALLNEGVPSAQTVVAQARAKLAADSEVAIVCDLFIGQASAEILTTDLSPDYVKFNAEYET
ncbi:MAG: bifunctional glutamate N-acetyltransferase/amino-acid acetyltransferase ArgJ [Actinomycetota bacterium]|nr:bifunctional glutamate N-acetyltransferase/amino-acid acetyltransferase ArgJ [Actinomycetota bacterium]